MTKVTRRVLHIFLSLYLCLTICSVSARPGLCSCGQACSHFLSDQQPDDNLPYQKHCHRSDCKTCKAEELTSFDMKAPRTEDYGKKSCESVHTNISCTVDPIKHYTSKQLDSIYFVASCNPPPIYLNDCSLIY